MQKGRYTTARELFRKMYPVLVQKTGPQLPPNMPSGKRIPF